MILEENEISPSKLNRLIGSPKKISLKKLTPIGSASLILKKFENKTFVSSSIKIDSRCNIAAFEKGILVYLNYSNKLNAIPIHKKELLKINLICGKEIIKPIRFSPMWILLKLGIPMAYARYFRIYRLHEYQINHLKLEIETTQYKLNMIANGYTYERQESFFKSLNLKNKLAFK